MEVVKNEKPTMSEFCEYLMETSAKAAELKQDGDVGLVMVSDGYKIACRISGNPLTISHLILRKMICDPMFAKAVSLAVHHYVEASADTLEVSGEVSNDSAKTDDHGKEESN